MSSVFPTGNYDTTFTNLTTTNQTTVFTVATGFKKAYLVQFWAADTGGAARTIDIVATVSSTDYTLGKAVAVAANTPYVLELRPLVLKTGDTLKVTASNGSIHVNVTFIPV